MKNYTVRRYETNDFALWNAFVSNANNATFLFHRDYMEYHQDRFSDFSLLVFEDQKLISVIPANKTEEVVYSHQGLTYGGFVFDAKVKLGQVISVAKAVLLFLHDNNIPTFQIKVIPSIYPTYFSEEMAYVLFLCEAQLIRRDCLSVLDLTLPYSFSKDRVKCARRAAKYQLEIKEEPNFDLFWKEILIPNLERKHQSKPVHTAAEIKKLQQKFPENIRHFNVYKGDALVAGTTVFCTENVAHPQYISGNQQKNELGSLDFLYSHLITDIFKDKHYFDFGPSHEEQGKKINEGILFWKESFGAKTAVQHYYEVATAKYQLLENILI